MFDDFIFRATTWILPALIAITFHEAAHGFVAERFGDPTAREAGRVTFNPLKHIDPFGTVILPGLLALMQAPFVLGWAKPVPVAFWRLRNPRRDMIWVAAAGPAVNIALAVAAALATHLVASAPIFSQYWLALNLTNAVLINVVLAVFNMIPLPPLDGGRVAVGLLPTALAAPLARLEPYGMLILIGVVFLLPLAAGELGYRINPLGYLIGPPVEWVFEQLTAISRWAR